MKVPRFRVAGIMAFVAIAALNFGSIRAWSQLRIGHGIGPDGRHISYINNTFDLLGVGALPMADVLVIGFLVGRRHRDSRPYFLVFEVFGVAALVMFVTWAIFYTEESVLPYIHSVLRPVGRFLRQYWPAIYPGPIFGYTVAAVMLGLPQLALALIGGLLFDKFRSAEQAE